MKPNKKAVDRYISTEDAAKIFKVSRHTIYKWCAKGRLSCKKEYYGQRMIRHVLVSSMKHARECVCDMCGKVFERENYVGARFCSAHCRYEWYWSKRRKYPFIGRPPKSREVLMKKWNKSLKTYERIKQHPNSYTSLTTYTLHNK